MSGLMQENMSNITINTLSLITFQSLPNCIDLQKNQLLGILELFLDLTVTRIALYWIRLILFINDLRVYTFCSKKYLWTVVDVGPPLNLFDDTLSFCYFSVSFKVFLCKDNCRCFIRVTYSFTSVFSN
jgi:hypothetical protein